jgi:hypothetical protein
VRGETQGIYLEGEGEEEIRRGMDLYEVGGKIPKASSRITGGKPWSSGVALRLPEWSWRRKKRGENEEVRGSPFIP